MVIYSTYIVTTETKILCLLYRVCIMDEHILGKKNKCCEHETGMNSLVKRHQIDFRSEFIGESQTCYPV